MRYESRVGGREFWGGDCELRASASHSSFLPLASPFASKEAVRDHAEGAKGVFLYRPLKEPVRKPEVVSVNQQLSRNPCATAGLHGVVVLRLVATRSFCS